MEIASAFGKLYPGKFDVPKMIELVGNASTIKSLEAGEDPVAILATWDGDLENFQKIREQYLLYR
jgi:exo-beta-N-acetylmuramidase NamZ-like protein